VSPGLPGAAPRPPRARALPAWVAALSVAAAVALAALGAPAVHAAEAPQVRIEHTFALGADAVWARLGRFCSIAEWQSLVAGCVVDERRDGIHRTVVMRNDTAYVERLERFSHEERRLAYSILSGPLPVRRYVSELQVLPVDAKRSLLVWQAWYEGPAGTEAAAVARDLSGLFRNGIQGMERLLTAD
jgi:hypothetical protein